MDLTGIRLGGAVKQQNVRREQAMEQERLGLTRRQVDLSEQELAYNQGKSVIERGVGVFDSSLEEVSAMIATIKENADKNGDNPALIEGHIDQVIQKYAGRLGGIAEQINAAGGNGEFYMNRFLSNAQAAKLQLSPTEKAQLEGKSEGIKDYTSLETFLGRTPTITELAEYKGIDTDKADLDETELNWALKYRSVGEEVTIDKGFSQATVNLVGDLTPEQALSARTTTQDTPSGLSDLTEKSTAPDALAQLSKSVTTRKLLFNLGVDFKNTPEAGGIPGTIIEKYGGGVQQVLDAIKKPDLLEGLGIDINEAKSIRQDAKRALSRQIGVLIGEEDNPRYTDADREFAKDIQSLLDADETGETIAASIKKLQSIEINADFRALNDIIRKRDFIINKAMSKEKLVPALSELKDILMSAGMEEPHARLLLEMLLKQRGINDK